MRTSFTLAKVAGIKISLHWTFVVLIGLVALSSVNPGQEWNIAFILTVFFCVVLHELGHAMAAQRYGIRTREIILLPIGGIARLDRIPEKPKQELIVALAGPMVNLTIASVLFFPLRNEINQGLESTLAAITGHNFLMHLFMVNLSLFGFNLLPIFPMDGGRILRALLSFRIERVKATRIAARAGQLIVFLVVAASIFFGQPLASNPLLIFIGFFVFFAAQTELNQVELRSFLSGYHVKSVTMKQFRVFQVTDPLSKVVESLLNSQDHDFVINSGEKLAGTLSRNQIVKALAAGNRDVQLGEIMEKDFCTAEASEPLEAVFDAIQRRKDRFMLIMENKKLLGVVDFENILEFIMLRRASKQAANA